jgi:glutamate dehydrogenase
MDMACLYSKSRNNP